MYEKCEPSAALRGKIINSIIASEEKRSKSVVLASAVPLPFSIGLFIYAVNYMINAFALSGFSEYLNLFVSDIDIVLANWKIYALSLAESFPALEISLLLATMLFVLVCARFMAISIFKLTTNSLQTS